MDKVNSRKFINRTMALCLSGIMIYTGCMVYPTLVKKSSLERTWAVYKADAEGTGYSDLNQINTENVQELKLAWTHKFNDAPQGSRGSSSESNPIILDGVMYTLSARHRVYALKASTG
jgi:quinoprotein glucose dehydrogenase